MARTIALMLLAALSLVTAPGRSPRSTSSRMASAYSRSVISRRAA
jgi:hypothetical protein